MSCCSAPPNRSIYATGSLPSGEALDHPGGLALTRRALQLAALPAGARILDIGSGSGQTLRLLTSLGFRALGVDPAATSNSTFPCIRASAESLPLPDASIDAVLFECTLSLVEDQLQALRECARILVPGGRLLIADLYARAPENIHAIRALGRSCVAGMIVREELEPSLHAADFRIDLWEDHSPALREFVARFLLQGGDPRQLWGCSATSPDPDAIAQAMRSVRAGYFLLAATRPSGENP